MHLSNILVIVFSLTVTILIFVDTSSAMFLPCRRCASIEECNLPPPNVCVWGENRDYCNRRICSKGPGEQCGDKSNLQTCAEGLYCSERDNKCHGCFLPTMECYTGSDYY